MKKINPTHGRKLKIGRSWLGKMRDPTSKITRDKGLEEWLKRGRVPAYQVQNPKFKPQYHQKN
jgi:hypothetical protein